MQRESHDLQQNSLCEVASISSLQSELNYIGRSSSSEDFRFNHTNQQIYMCSYEVGDAA